MREYESLVDGKLVPSSGGATFSTRNLVTGEPVSLVSRAAARDVRRALDAARRAFDGSGWAGMHMSQRAALLLPVADALLERQAEIADVETAEAGTPIRIASALSSVAIDRFRAHVETAISRDVSEERPRGVLAVRPARDAPFARALEALGPALLAGNAVVLCASVEAPSGVMELARALWESDLPPGVVNVVAGAADADEELASNPLADGVSFAGAVAAARRFAELVASSLRPAFVDASAPATGIVLADADFDLAVPGVLFGAMFLSGRSHRPLARVLVDVAIAEPFVHHLARGAAALRTGDPASFSTDVGPLAGDRALESATRAIARALEEGAAIARGGEAAGYGCFAPTVLRNVGAGARIRAEHVDAPVLAVTTFDAASDAIALANESAGDVAVWSRDAGHMAVLTSALRAERVWMNDFDPIAAPGWDSAGALSRPDPIASPPNAARARQALLGLDTVFGFDAPPYA